MGARRRSPFVNLVERQLAIFAEERAGLLTEIGKALSVYDHADADEAEERYGDYVDLVDAAREGLEDIRDTYVRTLPDEVEAEYREVFGRLALKRFPRIAMELE